MMGESTVNWLKEHYRLTRIPQIGDAANEIERLRTEGEIANARNSELLAENQIMYRELDRISRSVAGSPHLVKLARGALERVSGRRGSDNE